MSIEMQIERLRAEIEALKDRARLLAEEVAGWEAVAQAGADEISVAEAEQRGLISKILASKNLLEDL
jgi:hypothetical protein